MQSFLYQIARLGFLLSLFTHIATFRSMDMQKELPVVWILYFGVFVVWVPTFFLLRYAKEVWKRLPVWILATGVVLIVYAAVNAYLQIEAPYRSQSLYRTRFFSAYWMAFYFLSACVLAPHLEERS